MNKLFSIVIIWIFCFLLVACSNNAYSPGQAVLATPANLKSPTVTNLSASVRTSTPTLTSTISPTVGMTGLSTVSPNSFLAQLSATTSQLPVTTLAFSPNSRVMAEGRSNGSIQLIGVPDGKELKVIQAHNSAIQALAFSPDGKTVASGAAENTVKFWSVVNGQLIKQLKVDSLDVTGLKFSPAGDRLLTLGTKPFTGFQLWSVENCQLEGELIGADNYQVRAADFSPDNTLIGFDSDASIYHDPGLHLWRFREVKSSDKLDLPFAAATIGEKDLTTALSFSPDSKLVASAYIPGVPSEFKDKDQSETAGFEIWSTVDTKKRLVKVDGISDYINWLAFSPDGQVLFSAGKEQVIKMWNVQNGQEIFHTAPAQTSGLQAVALSSDGKYIATSQSDGSLKLWQVK